MNPIKRINKIYVEYPSRWKYQTSYYAKIFSKPKFRGANHFVEYLKLYPESVENFVDGQNQKNLTIIPNKIHSKSTFVFITNHTQVHVKLNDANMIKLDFEEYTANF